MREPRKITEAKAKLSEEQKKLEAASCKALKDFDEEKISLNEALEAVNAWNAVAPLPGMKSLHPLKFLRIFGVEASKHPLTKSQLEIFIGERRWNGKIYGDAVYLDGERVKIDSDMIKDHALRKDVNSDFPENPFPNSPDAIVAHGEEFARWFIKDKAKTILEDPLFFEPWLKALLAAVTFELDEEYGYFCPLKRQLYESAAEAEFFSIWNKMLELKELELKEYGLVLKKKRS